MTFGVFVNVDFANNNSIEFAQNFDYLSDLASIISSTDLDDIALDDGPAREHKLEGAFRVTSREVVGPFRFVEPKS